MTSALALSTGAAGVVALGAAAVLLAAGRRGGRTAGAHVLPALAAGLWGAGATLAAVRDPAERSLEPWWSLAVVALAVAGAGLLPRPAREPLDRGRRVTEVLVVACALAMLTFNTWRPPAGTSASGEIAAVSLSLLGATLVAILLVTAVRDLDAGALVATAGAALYVAGDLSGMVARLDAPGGSRAQLVLGGAGWLLLCAGLLSSASAPPARTERMRGNTEARRLVITTVLPLLLVLLATLAFVVSGSPVRPPDLVLWCAFMSAFISREAVRGTQQSRLLRRLAELAATDPLTGIGNRRALEAALERLHTPPHRPSSVLTIDLDGFKDINTLLGHQNGDAVLVAVAAELAAQCRRTGVPAQPFRLGGDEFGVLVDGAPDDAEELAARLLVAIPQAATAVPGAGRVDVSASIGLAHREAPADGAADGAADDLMTDLTQSGHAMRAAKAAGRARAMTYGTPMARRQSRAAAIERRLRERVNDGRGLEVWFQPVISLSEMRMTGAESLARWGEDAELGVVTPAEFIPVAEDSGLIVELGRQLVRRTMEATVATGARDAALVTGVNVSPVELRAPGLVTHLARLLDELGIPPGRFVLEITESVCIEHDDPAIPAIRGIADLGLSVALDDFGTGYSALSYLTDLPVRILKLDKTITQRLGDPRGLAVARCVSDMARELDIDVVAEGVETAEHLDTIRRLSVGFGQGWLFSAAVPPDRFADFVREPALALSAGSGLPVKTP